MKWVKLMSIALFSALATSALEHGATVAGVNWLVATFLAMVIARFDMEAKADARLIAAAPKLYDRLLRLVNEISKVLDHTPQGYCVIYSDCSGIELAKVEAEEILAKAGGAE